jgi:hypothetical protein
MKEKILCAAINFNGTIICGFRHSDCYQTLKDLLGEIDTNKLPDRNNQGFLTSKNKYVGREEAWIIALDNNQIIYGLEASKIPLDIEGLDLTGNEKAILISENLY